MPTEYLAVAFTILLTVATSVVVGRYMFHVFAGRRTPLDPVLVPIERLVLRLTGVDPSVQQDWKRYSMSLLISNVVMWLATFAIVSRAGTCCRSTRTASRTWSRRWRSTRSPAS